MPDCRAFMDHDATFRLEELDERTRWKTVRIPCRTACGVSTLRTVVTGRLEYPHTLLDGRTRIAFVVWWVNTWQEGDVDTELVLGEFPCLTDGIAERVRRRLRQSSEDAYKILVSGPFC